MPLTISPAYFVSKSWATRHLALHSTIQSDFLVTGPTPQGARLSDVADVEPLTPLALNVKQRHVTVEAICRHALRGRKENGSQRQTLMLEAQSEGGTLRSCAGS